MPRTIFTQLLKRKPIADICLIHVNPVVGHTSGPGEALWYWEPYGKQVSEYVKDKVKVLVDLYGPKATTEEFKKAVVETSPNKVCGCGHGNETTWTGYALADLIWVNCEPERIPVGSEMFILSCRTGYALGPWLVTKGVQAYLGWKADYVFWVVYGVRKSPEQTKVDYIFLKPIEEAMEKWAVGEWTLRDAYNYIYNDYMEKASDPNLPPDIAASLIWDAVNMVLIEAAPAEKMEYKISLALPDGTTAVLAEGAAPYPQDVYSVTVTLPAAGPEGEGKLTVAVKLQEMTGEDSIPVVLKKGALKVKIVKPEPGATLIYGSKTTIEFTVRAE